MLRERDFQQRFASGMAANPGHGRTPSMARTQNFTHDDFGMPSPTGSGSSSQRSSGFMGRLKMLGSHRSRGGSISGGSHYGGGGGGGGGFDDDDEDGLDGSYNAISAGHHDNPAMRDSSMRELQSMIGDRHRYPTFDGFNSANPGSRAMSMTSMSTRDSAPIIPVLQHGIGRPGNVPQSQAQYLQKMVESRRALMSSETGLPAPQVLGSGNNIINNNGRLHSLTSIPGNGPPMHHKNLYGSQGESTMSLGTGREVYAPPRGSFSSTSLAPPHEGVQGRRAGPSSGLPTGVGPGHGPPPQQAIYSGSIGSMTSGSELESLRQRQQAMQIERDGMINHIQELVHRIQRLESEVASSSAGAGASHPRTLDPNNNDLGSRYDELLSQHNDLLEEHTQVHRELQQTKARVNELVKAAAAQKEADLKRTKSAAEKESSSAAAAAANAANAESAASAAREAARKAEAIAEERQAKIGELQAKLAEHEKQAAEHKQQLEEKQALATELASALEEERRAHNALQEHNLDLEAAHSVLADRFAILEVQAPTENLQQVVDTLNELTERLQAEIDSLTVELAESSRREQGLPTTSNDESLPGKLAAVTKQLSIEREKRLIAEKIHPPRTESYSLAELEHRHAEAIQALNIRNQHYDMMQQKLTALEGEITSAQDEIEQLQLNYSHASQSSASQAEIHDLAKHLEVVKAENAKLQLKLDDFSDKSPLSERLKSTEKQRDTLQDALRSLRERKDQEIVLLQDRVDQLNSKIEKAARSGTRVYSGVHFEGGEVDSSPRSESRVPPRLSSGSFFTQSLYGHENSSHVSLDDNQGLDVASISPDRLGDQPLERPRIPKLNRPSSPLHLNFKMGSNYLNSSEATRSRTEFRQPLPLALSESQQ